jgi:hypothetical protein
MPQQFFLNIIKKHISKFTYSGAAIAFSSTDERFNKIGNNCMGDKSRCNALFNLVHRSAHIANYDELVNGFISNKGKKMKKMLKSDDADRRSVTRTATRQSKFHSSGTYITRSSGRKRVPNIVTLFQELKTQNCTICHST